jgi:predicted phosphodiesterase
MRIALISDVHGNHTALTAVLADLEAQAPCDAIWVLGDLAAFGPQPAECIATLRALRDERGADQVRIVGGNTDRYLVTGERPASRAADEAGFAALAAARTRRDAALNWGLAQLDYSAYTFLAEILGQEIALDVPGFGRVIGFHAVPGDDEGAALAPNTPDEVAADALLDREGVLAVCGHTHTRMQRQVGRWQVINPGAVSLSFTQQGIAEWAVLTLGADGLHVDLRDVPYDTGAVLAAADALGYPDRDGLARGL